MANVYQPIVERFVSDLEALIQRSICEVIIEAIGQTSSATAASSKPARPVRTFSPAKPRRPVRKGSPGAEAKPVSAFQQEAQAGLNGGAAALSTPPVVRSVEPVPPPRFVRLPPRGKARPQRKREEAMVTESPAIAPSTGPIAPIKRVRTS